MTINIAKYDFPGIWEGIYHFTLSDYPSISDWELRKLLFYIDYEKSYNRETEITCNNDEIMQAVRHAIANPSLFLSAQKPTLITECTACKQHGCLTDFVCHITGIENAKSIFKCGKILSAVKARNKTGEELVAEREKTPFKGINDPPDYYDYIMLSWGNCQAGDRIVMERILGRFPEEYDVSAGFKPGVRFYFEYESVEKHKGFTNDGMHPAKIKDELSLNEYLFCCIIPESNKAELEKILPPYLADRVFYIENDCKDIWEWSEKVYDFVCGKRSETT